MRALACFAVLHVGSKHWHVDEADTGVCMFSSKPGCVCMSSLCMYAFISFLLMNHTCFENVLTAKSKVSAVVSSQGATFVVFLVSAGLR